MKPEKNPKRLERPQQVPVSVEFCGSLLDGVIHGGKAFVAMKPIVEGMGLDWSAQFAKIKKDDVLGSVIAIIAITAADGKRYETLCLPEEYLQGWLFTISASKVKLELRAKIVTYKRECYRVLHQAFTQGAAETNLRVMAIDSKRASGRLMAEIKLEVLTLAGKEPKPHDFSNEHRLCNWALTHKYAALDESTLSNEHINALAALRRRNSTLIAMGVKYEARKAVLEAYAVELQSKPVALREAA